MQEARYEMWMSPKKGIIIAAAIYAPIPLRGKQLPPMPSKWSDLTFLAWKQLCAEASVDPANLRYVLQSHVSNTKTTTVAMGLTGTTLMTLFDNVPEWPGVGYDTTTFQGQALMGVPNGYGTSYLLLQHQATFGNRNVVRATMFKDDSGEFCLLYDISKIPVPAAPTIAGEPLGVDSLNTFNHIQPNENSHKRERKAKL